MLIAIFAMMLISVVAIALVVTSGTDTALAGNYRSASGAYYASLAGLEEARGRLLWKNPNCLVNRPFGPANCPNTGFIPMDPVTGLLPAMQLTDVRYILNPAVGETVDPTSSNPANYPDTNYQAEFGWSLSGANVQTTTSVSPQAGFPGPAYKWVRINPITEKALGVDVNGDGSLDPVTPLVYDPAPARTVACPSSNPTSGLFVPSCPGWQSSTAVQVLEITAYSQLPSGGKRLLQYVLAPVVISTQAFGASSASYPPSPFPTLASFPAALTFLGNGVTFQGPGTSSFVINGQDHCTGSSAMVYSIGYINPADQPGIVANAVPANNFQGYPPGSGGPPPPVGTAPATIANVDQSPTTALVNPAWLTPASLDRTVQDIQSSADVVLTGPVTGSDIANAAPAMLANPPLPMTIVVNGDLDLNAWSKTGFGVLLVTGTLKYDPDASWEGLVLVIGQGNFVSTKSGTGGIDGAMVIAKTRDSSNNLLSSLGGATFSQTGGGSNLGSGINYNSCPHPFGAPPMPLSGLTLKYKILSFREIPTS